MRLFKKPAIVFLITIVSCFSHITIADAEKKDSLPTPQLLKIDGLSDADLTTLEAPWPARSLVSGVETHRVHSLFSGQVTVSIYDADDGKLKLENYPFDEFVHVLNGQAILSVDGGISQTFKAGDSFIVPKGFTGTWEMKDNFRELIIIEKKAYDAGVEILFAE